MSTLILAARAAVAVTLIVAGGAKLADVPGFAATLRLFVPWRLPRPAARGAAAGIAAAECLLGAASLAAPAARWLPPAVFAVTLAFVAVAAVGYRLLRGRSCSCFGPLSRREFDAAGLARAAAIAVIAATGLAAVPAAAVRLSPADRVLLGAAAIALAGVALAAARALQAARLEPRRA